MEARELAMFPLGSVLFPYAQLPLHVFEPRYRVLMHDVLAGDRELGVVLIERGHEVGGGDERFDVGTLASLVSATEIPDGRWAVLAVGVRRIRVQRWLADDPYPRAIVVELDDTAGSADPEAFERQRTATLAAFAAVLGLVSRLDPRVASDPVELSRDPIVASFEAAARSPVGPLDAQRLLEIDTAIERLAAVERLLGEQLAILRARLDLPDV